MKKKIFTRKKVIETDIHFRLLKNIDVWRYKKGKIFDCFGGLVSGISGDGHKTILFSDKKYFSIIYKTKKVDKVFCQLI